LQITSASDAPLRIKAAREFRAFNLA
jgi:hypothetical protein